MWVFGLAALMWLALLINGIMGLQNNRMLPDPRDNPRHPRDPS